MTLNRMRIPVIAAAGLLALAACSSGTSQEQLDAAREAGASEAQKQLEEQQTLEDLQDKVDELKEQKQESRAEARKARKAARKAARRAENNDNNNGGGGGGGGGGTSGLSGPVTACGDGIYAGANTSCSFAMNVAGEWGSTPRTVLEAYSPVTGQYYTMTCSSWSGGGHVCTGGNNASVYFP